MIDTVHWFVLSLNMYGWIDYYGPDTILYLWHTSKSNTKMVLEFILKGSEAHNKLVINLQILKSDTKLLYYRVKYEGDI